MRARKEGSLNQSRNGGRLRFIQCSVTTGQLDRGRAPGSMEPAVLGSLEVQAWGFSFIWKSAKVNSR